MQIDELFNNGTCVQCKHKTDSHELVVGQDENRRIWCKDCPYPAFRMMGDEGSDLQTIPFFIEASFGPPDPCFEEHPTTRNVTNFLPYSPTGDGDVRMQFTAHIEGDDGAKREFQFIGVAWRVAEVDQLKQGDDVKGNLVYKRQLYWDQTGKCVGCKSLTAFHIMEMDRKTPGRRGGGYTVGNVQLLCVSCNRIKGKRDMAYLKERLRSLGRFERPGWKEETDESTA